MWIKCYIHNFRGACFKKNYSGILCIFPLKNNILVRLMRDAKASRSKTCPPLEKKKQNTFAYKNKFESTSVPLTHKEKGL